MSRGGRGEVLGAVLAGGASSRFGSDKASAMLEGRTLLDRAVAALTQVTGHVVVVGRPGGVPDRPESGLGPLGGLAGALDHAGRHGFASVLTIGCDMPAVPAGLLAAVLERVPSYCVEAPVLGHWPAALADDLLDRLATVVPSADDGARHARSPALSIRRWAATVGAVAVEAAVPLANVNTPADLAAL